MSFWLRAGPDSWFAKDAAFDGLCRNRFLDLHMEVAAGRHDEWLTTAEGTAALILLVDQIPRNVFRGTGHMYATDGLARHYARQALAGDMVGRIAVDLHVFVFLPFAHSEALADQDLSVMLHTRLGEPWLSHAEAHRDIIRRFGRFPHRNSLLGRETKPEEAQFLENGGFAG